MRTFSERLYSSAVTTAYVHGNRRGDGRNPRPDADRGRPSTADRCRRRRDGSRARTEHQRQRRLPYRRTFRGGVVRGLLASETVDRTYLGELEAGEAVNLERAMPAEGASTGTSSRVTSTRWRPSRTSSPWVRIGSSSSNSPRDTSATSSRRVDHLRRHQSHRRGPRERAASTPRTEGGETAAAGRVTVAIIPTTYELTTLSAKEPGDPIHLEVDVLAKYVERLLEGHLE